MAKIEKKNLRNWNNGFFKIENLNFIFELTPAYSLLYSFIMNELCCCHVVNAYLSQTQIWLIVLLMYRYLPYTESYGNY